MNNILKVLRYVWDWIRIIFLKSGQTLKMMYELIRPSKSLTSRLCFLVWLGVFFAFVVNSFIAFWSTSVQIIEDKNHQCESDLAAMKAISDATLQDLDMSSDTITAADALAYLMKRLEQHKPSPDSHVCLTDTMGKVLHTESGLKLDSISLKGEKDSIEVTTMGMTPVKVNLGNVIRIGEDSYMSNATRIWRGQWNVVVLHNMKNTWGTLLDLFLEVTKRCVISLLLAFVAFLSMFVMMRHAMMRRQNMEGEIDLAGGIQQQMLPKAFPDSEKYSLHAFLRPAKTMGGDLYDYIERDNKLFFCIGDVSGKGMPAALLMSQVHSLFRNVARHTCRPEEIVSAINVGVADGNDSNMFCTLFVGVLDLETMLLNYCNAGHNHPVVTVPGKSPYMLDVVPNLAVGLFEDFAYQAQTLQMEDCMMVFTYTDGVTEAEDALSRLFSDQALIEGLCDSALLSPREVIDHVIGLVDRHARFADQSDDITMLCLKV